MRILFLILLLVVYSGSFGQTKSEHQRILTFKNDPLKDRTMYEPDTLYTSTAIFIRERLPDVRCISILPLNQNVKHVEYYYNDTEILESSNTYNLPNGEMTGISKQYNRKGQLEYVQDHDKGTWDVVRFENYPYYQTLVMIKGKVDSLIKATYGQVFFEKHVIWSPEGSAFYGNGGGSSWKDYHEWVPQEFLIRYSIRLSEDEMYDEQIEVRLDSVGRIIFPYDSLDNVKGFERNAKDGFALTKATAVEKAKAFGLVETDSSKAYTFLAWEYEPGMYKELFNGHFTYNVAINTDIIKYAPIRNRSRTEFKFDVYAFNPWTGDFIKKKKMKAIKEQGPVSGFSTGLLPDGPFYPGGR